MLERVKPLTLEFLNRATQAWVEQDYNRGLHEEIKMTPLERQLQSPSQARPCPPLATLQQAFCQVTQRVQRRSEGTVSLEGVRFEVPNHLRALSQMLLRYRRWDLSEAYIVEPRNSMAVMHRITPADKARNADGRRRTLQPNATSEHLSEGPARLPPLMTQWLADYAATGNPPAYLPLHTAEVADDHE